jgi:hypothetical protein
LIKAIRNPPQAWTDAWAADGAKQVFGLYFGWFYAMVYFTLWFVPAWIIKTIIRPVKQE